MPRILPASDFYLDDATGSIWRGGSELFFRDQYVGTLAWRLNPWTLFFWKLESDYSLAGEGLELHGTSEFSINHRQLTLAGSVNSRFVNRFTLAYDLRFSEEFSLNDVKVVMNGDDELAELQGHIRWEGGPVHFKLANQVHDVTLEPVRGYLSNATNNVNLEVQTIATNEPVLTFRTDLDTGWMHITALPAFLEFAEVPTNRFLNDTNFVFEVSQKIF